MTNTESPIRHDERTMTTTEPVFDPTDDAFLVVDYVTFLRRDGSFAEGDHHPHTAAVVLDDGGSVTTYVDGNITERTPWKPGVEVPMAIAVVDAYGTPGTWAGPGGYPIEHHPISARVGDAVYPYDTTTENDVCAAIYRWATDAAHDYYDVAVPSQ